MPAADFESILLGSEETVAQVGAGILSLTMPIKAYDLVNTADMVLRSAGAADQKENPDTQKNGVRRNRIISVMQNFC